MAAPFRVSKNCTNAIVSCIMEETGVFCMEEWRRNEREQFVFTDLEGLVPQDHLLRRVEKVMDYEWLYAAMNLKKLANWSWNNSFLLHFFRFPAFFVQFSRNIRLNRRFHPLKPAVL